MVEEPSDRCELLIEEIKNEIDVKNIYYSFQLVSSYLIRSVAESMNLDCNIGRKLMELKRIIINSDKKINDTNQLIVLEQKIRSIHNNSTRKIDKMLRELKISVDELESIKVNIDSNISDVITILKRESYMSDDE